MTISQYSYLTPQFAYHEHSNVTYPQQNTSVDFKYEVEPLDSLHASAPNNNNPNHSVEIPTQEPLGMISRTLVDAQKNDQCCPNYNDFDVNDIQLPELSQLCNIDESLNSTKQTCMEFESQVNCELSPRRFNDSAVGESWNSVNPASNCELSRLCNIGRSLNSNKPACKEFESRVHCEPSQPCFNGSTIGESWNSVRPACHKELDSRANCELSQLCNVGESMNKVHCELSQLYSNNNNIVESWNSVVPACKELDSPVIVSSYSSSSGTMTGERQVIAARRKGSQWSQDEHKLFLLGLNKFGRGDWKSISRIFVKTRSSTQVASHAQKFFLRHGLRHDSSTKKKRSSIHNITKADPNDIVDLGQRGLLPANAVSECLALNLPPIPHIEQPHVQEVLNLPLQHQIGETSAIATQYVCQIPEERLGDTERCDPLFQLPPSSA